MTVSVAATSSAGEADAEGCREGAFGEQKTAQ